MSDPAENLPDVSFDNWNESDDPVIALTLLIQKNAEIMNRLSGQGINIGDGHPRISVMVIQALLEAILRTVAGEAAVVQAMTEANTAVANLLDGAEKEVERQKLLAPLTGMSGHPGQNGNRAARRG